MHVVLSMMCTNDVILLILCACSVINLLFYISLSKKKRYGAMLNGLSYSTVNKSSMSISIICKYQHCKPELKKTTS